MKKSDLDGSDEGESGNTLEYFIFEDYTALNKLLRTKKNLSSLNNVTLLTKDNFELLREYVKKLIEGVKLKLVLDKTSELSKKYKEKIKNSKKFSEKKSEIRLLRDLEIEEIYKKILICNKCINGNT